MVERIDSRKLSPDHYPRHHHMASFNQKGKKKERGREGFDRLMGEGNAGIIL